MCSRTIPYALVSGLSLLGLLPGQGVAQFAVQQPVMGVNSVSTTVSVPDRGRVHLGGISGARDSRVHFGPFRPGTSTGLEREHSSMSVGVYIHDFEAMDQYLLNQGSPSTPHPPQMTGGALHALEQLQGHRGGSSLNARPDLAKAAKSQKYWDLGQKAEREGKLEVAKLHYRAASRHGSQAAQSRLNEFDAATPSTRIAGAGR